MSWITITKGLFGLVTILAISGTTTGCTTTRAYQRSKLAKPKMQLEPDPDAAIFEQHVYEYREGSAGGYGGGGGGCGCN